MTWAQAIEKNRLALLAVVAAIAALVGGRVLAGPVARSLRNAALLLLRPAESAARRLIVAAARDVTVAQAGPRAPFPGVIPRAGAESAAGRIPAFPLFDRLKSFAPLAQPVPSLQGAPRIRTFWAAPSPLVPFAASPPAEGLPPVLPALAMPAAPDPDAPVDAGRLSLRLMSLERALASLPAQARRLARLRQRIAYRQTSSDRWQRAPLRPGPPPGQRRSGERDIDRVLGHCHMLARDALAQPPKPAAIPGANTS